MNNQEQVLQKPLNNKIKIQPFIDRYTTRYYSQDGTYLFKHTNELLIIGISKALIEQKGNIKEIEFLFKNKFDDLKKIVKGKKKAGGIQVSPGQKLIKLIFESDEEYIIKSNVKGHIIEINDKIIDKNFEILNNKPEKDGFIFIINPPLHIFKVDEQIYQKIEYGQQFILDKNQLILNQ